MGVFSWLLLQVKLTTQISMNKFIVPFLVCSASVTNSQLKFGGSSTSSSGSSSSNDKQAVDNKDVDTRFISTGSELIDGGLLGVGAGLLGGAVLGGVLGNNNNNNPCGRRRRRQADGKDGTDTRFFLPNLGGGGGCNCGRRKRRQAPHEDDAGTRFFGLENLLGGGSNCGCNCGGQSGGYNNGGYNNGGYNNNGGFNQPQVQCQCNNQLTFRDKYGNTHGACRRADETGRTWCYTYGGCPDSRPSKRFPNNPWSYQACNQYSG